MPQIGKAKPITVDRMGSYVDWDDPTTTTMGLARLAQNCRYVEKSVGVRFGFQRALSSGVAASKTLGLGILNFKGSPDKNTVLQFGSDGTMWKENVEGSGNLVAQTSTLVPLAAAAGNFAQMAQAQNRLHIAFGDLVKGSLTRPAVLDNSGNLDPISYPQVGQAWEANRYYNIGTMISPTVANGHLYRATTAGLSHATTEPVWPTADASTIVDNAITWQEFTPAAGTVLPTPTDASWSITRHGGAGTFAAGRDVYIVIALNNGNGDSLVSNAKVLINTVLNDAVKVAFGVTFPQWLNGLAGAFAIVGVTIYEASVATGAGAPVTSAYKKVGTFAYPGVGAGAPDVGNDAGGAAPPVTSAAISGAGNICAGTRNMVILQKNRNLYIGGMTNAAVITFNVPVAGFQLWVGNIPVGPGNCIARVAAFTLAGDPTAGPYRYIGKNDTDPALGVTIVSTVVNDNVTTGQYMQFTDSYLPTGGVEVTLFFNKKEMPFVHDVAWLKSTRRMAYTGDPANRSSVWLSEPDDVESIFSNTASTGDLVNISTQDGGALVCVREMGSVIYALKSNGGHILTPTTDDPLNWNATQQWYNSGPCGPRAIDIVDTDTQRIMAYIDENRKGLYVYMGTAGPEFMSNEMTNVFNRVNWAVKQKIWVLIDPDAQEVHIGLPLDGATWPNKELVVNYNQGWGPPYIFTVRGRTFIAVPGRKWSINDLNATGAIIAHRTLSAPPDSSIANSQLLFASSAANKGDVYVQVPNYYSDLLDGVNKTAIDGQYKLAFVPQQSSAVNSLEAVEIQSRGNGRASVTVVGTQNKTQPKVGVTTFPDIVYVAGDTTNMVEYAEGTDGTVENYGFGLEITNKNTKDFWFELHHTSLFVQPRYRTRT